MKNLNVENKGHLVTECVTPGIANKKSWGVKILLGFSDPFRFRNFNFNSFMMLFCMFLQLIKEDENLFFKLNPFLKGVQKDPRQPCIY